MSGLSWPPWKPKYVSASSEATTLWGSPFSILPGALTCSLPCTVHISIHLPINDKLSDHAGLCQGTAPSWEVPPTPREPLMVPGAYLTYHVTSYITVASLFVFSTPPPISICFSTRTVSFSPLFPQFPPQCLAHNGYLINDDWLKE